MWTSGGIEAGWMKGCFHSPISGAACLNTRWLEVEYLDTFKRYLAFFHSSSWCSSLPELTLPFFLLLMMTHYVPSYSDRTLLLSVTLFLSSWHFLLPLPTQFWIPINSVSRVTPNSNQYLKCLVSNSIWNNKLFHLLFVYCLLFTIALQIQWE